MVPFPQSHHRFRIDGEVEVIWSYHKVIATWSSTPPLEVGLSPLSV